MKDLHTLLDNWPLTHHAYVIESSHSLVPSITKAIKDHDVSYIYEKEFDTMKIDDARTIKELQRERTEKASVLKICFVIPALCRNPGLVPWINQG
mgnify:CR=1 FL=1